MFRKFNFGVAEEAHRSICRTLPRPITYSLKRRGEVMWRLQPPTARGALRLLLATLCTAAVGALSIASAQAAAPITFTDTFTLTDTFTDVVPCHPELGAYEVMLVGRGVVHVTAAGTDEEGNPIAPFHFTGTTTGTFVWVPSDGTGPTFTGSFTQRVGENVNTQNGTETVVFRLHATGSDGSSFSVREIFHVRINALGVEVSFDRPSC
jgi:hypothetical protein